MLGRRTWNTGGLSQDMSESAIFYLEKDLALDLKRDSKICSGNVGSADRIYKIGNGGRTV